MIPLPFGRKQYLREPYQAGKFYSTIFGLTPNATAAVPAVDKIFFYPFPIWSPVVIKTLHMRVGTGGAGSSAKVGVWANSPLSHRPVGAPLAVDNTGQATTSNNSNTTHDVTDFLVNPGLYWFGSKFTGTLPNMLNLIVNSNWTSFWVPAGTSSAILHLAYSFDDAYSNNMPTLAEGATFTALTAAGVPVASFGT